MCAVSMIMDHYRERWQPLVPSYPQQPLYPVPQQPTITAQPGISDWEIAEFRRLLERAREYDKRNNEPECEMDEKKQAILAIAKQLGVEIAFL